MRTRCTLLGLILAWIVALYVPPALLAASNVVSPAPGQGIAAATWAMTDAVSVPVKLGYAVLSSALLLGVRRSPLPRGALPVADVLLAGVAMLVLLALLPEGWSRGFGVRLFGARVAPVPTLIYLIGAAMSGAAFTLADARCRLVDERRG